MGRELVKEIIALGAIVGAILIEKRLIDLGFKYLDLKIFKDKKQTV